MKLVTFTEKNGPPKVGKLIDKEIVEFDKALFPSDMVSLIEIFDDIKRTWKVSTAHLFLLRFMIS